MIRHHPIIFSAPMIRALLDGRKTQTRRLLRIPPHLDGDEAEVKHFQGAGPGLAAPMRDNPEHQCGVFPRYAIGDLLWVRETWVVEALGSSAGRDVYEVQYPADHWCIEIDEPDDSERARFLSRCYDRRRSPLPSIHMPQWASRLTLQVTDVRVQRLLDISEDDAVAEGFAPGLIGEPVPETPIGGGWTISSPGCWASAAGHFQALWAELHPHWDGYSSPWVVALTFSVLHDNIDRVRARLSPEAVP